MSTSDWHVDGATNTAKELRRSLRAAIKDGTLPAGCTVSVRKSTASMMTAVDVHLITPDPSVYFDSDNRVWTVAGCELARTLAGYMAPHLHKVDGRMSFLDAHVDGLGLPTDIDFAKSEEARA